MTAAAAAFGPATPASAAKPDAWVNEWFSGGFITCTASDGTVHRDVMSGHGWKERTMSFLGKDGAVTRTQSKATGYGYFSNLATGIGVDDKVTRTTRVDASTGNSTVVVHALYYQDGKLVLQQTGRTVRDGDGSVIRQSGIPNDPNRTALCDLMD